MKGVLDWVKKNLIIVIAAVLILVLLPVGWVFSSRWNDRVQAAAAQAFSSTRSELQRAGSVGYTLPAVLEGETSVSETRAPNRAVTRFFEEQKGVRESQVADVAERGTAFNKRDHGVLVPGLFPKANSNTELRLRGLEMAEQIAGRRDAEGNTLRASVYEQLLRSVNAGSPPDPAELGGVLADYASTMQQQFTSSSTDGRLTEEQASEVAQQMVARRLQEYAGRARSLTFYAGLDALLAPGGQAEPGWSTIPATPPPQGSITEADAFVWQWDYWVVDDVLDAVALANTDPVSGAMSVPDAPVKRVERLRISAIDLPAPEAADAGAGFGGRTGGAAGMTGSDAAGPATHTGRSANPDYDVRTVELTVIASSRDLPRLFDALGRVNYMTVVDVDLGPVEVWNHLDQGYFYGEDHVVRAVVTVETVWLRSWTLPLMPDRVRQAVGAPPAAQDAPDADDEP